MGSEKLRKRKGGFGALLAPFLCYTELIQNQHGMRIG
jgi:hypothetical protein